MDSLSNTIENYFFLLFDNDGIEMSTTISMAKLFLFSGFGNIFLLKADVIDFTQFGLLGLVVTALFSLVYALLRPMLKMQAEAQKAQGEQIKIDNELKTKMSQNIEQLNLLITKQGLKTENNFILLNKEIKELRSDIGEIKK